MAEALFPQGLIWDVFKNICAIPHPSGHESALAEWVVEFAIKHNLQVSRAKVGNLRIVRPATAGFEQAPRVIMQGHLDMVPQTSDSNIDLTTTPIHVERSGDTLHTGKKNTLGADNGIGVAMALAALVEAPAGGELIGLFTVEEETGLSGANQCSSEFLSGDYLINLDSELEGEFIVGCAGGARTKAFFDIDSVKNSQKNSYKLSVFGLKGGHSGCEIHCNHGNAIKILVDVLSAISEVQIANIGGGTLSNVIPSSSWAEFVCYENLAKVEQICQQKLSEWQANLQENGCELAIIVEEVANPTAVWSRELSASAIKFMKELPCGVVEMEADWQVPSVSNNLAKVSIVDNEFVVMMSQRALVDNERRGLEERIIALCNSYGGRVIFDAAYPGWRPIKESSLLKSSLQVYQDMYGKEPVVAVIHAGLECGIFAEKNPQLEMISLGPDMAAVHSVNESLSISSSDRVYQYLNKLLANLWQGGC